MIYSREVIHFSKARNRERLLRLLVTGLLLYMLFGFGAARLRLTETAERERRLEQRRTELSAENESLRRQLASLREDETLEALARERLGLVRPGERIYYFN